MMDLSNSSRQYLLETPPTENGRTAAAHKCARADGRHEWIQLISQWYLVCLYMVYTIGVAFGMTLWLNGRSFAVADDDSNPFSGKLTQTDVTTLISVALVIARTICAAWQALAAWRCIFILLEKTGLSLSEASCLASWRLPALTLFRSLHSDRADHNTARLVAVLVLILAWPAQFANPIASGAVSWIPSRAYEPNSTSLSLGTPTTSFGWSWYVTYGQSRDVIVKKSAGQASLTMATQRNTSGEINPVPPAQRMSPQFTSYPNGTALKNATVPIFKIESLQWVENRTTLPDEITKAILFDRSGYLNISREDSMLQQTIVGTSALLKDSPWIPPPSDRLPAPKVFSGTMYAAIYVSRNNNHGQADWNCKDGNSEFDPLPPGIDFMGNSWDNDMTDCIAVAKVRLTAGVTECRQESSRPSSDSSCILSSGVLMASNSTVSPGPLVYEVFAMMPEVQALVAALSLHVPGTLTNNLEAYLRNSLTQSYQGTWSALADFFADTAHEVQTEVRKPSLLLEAQVTTWRMYLWLGINLLLVVSGLFLAVIQSSCNAKTINDPVIATIMMDSSEVIIEDKSGLCNATDIGRGHGNADMKLLLKFGVPVPKGVLARTPAETIPKLTRKTGQPCVIKSQVLKGGRGKGSFENGLTGGIQIVDSPEAAESLASRMLGQRLKTKQTSGAGVVVDKLYVTETIEYQDEWYLAITLDRENYTPVIIASRDGGVNIEQTTKNNPESLHSFRFNLDEGITPELVSRIGNALQSTTKETDNLRDILTRLHAIFISKDATSLEINPLAKKSDGTFTCLDAKFTFDDASEKRQPELFAIRDDKVAVEEELEAQAHGLVYINMDGNIGNVVNGAGLAMATNDAIAYHGGASANFLDAGGQATKTTMQKAFEIILRDDRVKVILVNIYGGIIKCDMIAESIIGAAEELGPLRVPLVVRLQGTNSAQGLKILEEANLGFHVRSGFGEAAEKAVELAKQIE
ncbi:hypothetical protein FDECE_13839 [Fusarium decemcellulare]|nr:hypothetical protein FDECE_13839 [Fusarium decemcellulare]